MFATASRWFWTHEGQRGGPISWGELQSMARSGRLRASDLVMREGSDRWQPANTATEADIGPPIVGPGTPASFIPAPHQGFAPGFMPGAVPDERLNAMAGGDGGLGGISPGKVLFGAFLCVGGGIATFVSYSAAAQSPTGGRYYIFTGPIIWGLITMVRGFSGQRREG